MTWMIYGATGYTGQLVAREAVRRGHRPVLASRSAAKLEPLADELGLSWAAVDLEDAVALRAAVERVELVYHAAGPFIHTSAPMLHACLAAGAHYVDITGELPVFAHTFRHDAAARARGVALISGAGFDVVPSDSLAKYVADQVPNATELHIAIAALSRASAGTTKSMLEMLPEGVKVRRNGVLERQPFGVGAIDVRFTDQVRTVVPIPWGDLETAYRSTGVPNITTYMAVGSSAARLLAVVGPVVQRALGNYAARRIAQQIVEHVAQGPDEALRHRGRSYVWARAADGAGRAAEAWLETVEAYQFTALAGVRAVETVLAQRPTGALTPAQAFGADWVLGTEGTRRLDRLQ